MFEDWVCEQDNKFEGQNQKVLMIVDNCPAHPEIRGLKEIELCFLLPNNISITQQMNQSCSITKSQVPILNDLTNHQSN